jgi:hypothetical protein
VTDATLALAITDFVPVLLSAIALWRVRVLVAQRRPVLRPALTAGVVLVVTAGVVKASGKVVLAVSGIDVVVMNQGLFPLLAPGMLLAAVATSLALAGRGDRPVLIAWSVAGATWAVAAAVAATASWDAAKAVLIVIASAGNVALFVLLARAAARDGSRAAATLFAASLTVVLALAGMARTLEPTIANQWVEQSSNALAQAILVGAVATWSRALARRTATATDAIGEAIGEAGTA